MGVIMQTFYWDCPRLEHREFAWWDYVTSKLASLSAVGFTALWLPPANKAANNTSMGYDPYDYYDLGDVDQKGSMETWFGAKQALCNLITVAHTAGLQVYADFVLNHNSGGDGEEVNPIDNKLRWTKFTPLSGKFARDWTYFHPSHFESWDQMAFGDMPDLCHRNPHVYTGLLEYAQWLLEDIGFDGFRFDFVKGYGGWMVRAIQEMRLLRDDVSYKPYAVGECWDSDTFILDWLDDVNAWSDNPAGAFDFPLRYRLRDLCQSYGYSLRQLMTPGTLMTDRPAQAVTFVENHDVVRNDSIVTDKMLAYAVILTHPGYPCVFWQDYYVWGLGREGHPGGIAALVRAHEDHAGGDLHVLYVDDDLYIMQRTGWDQQTGMVFVLNNRGSWNGAPVQTQWRDTQFVPVAWCGRDDMSQPLTKHTGSDGGSDFWAAPRGYAVYAPQRLA